MRRTVTCALIVLLAGCNKPDGPFGDTPAEAYRSWKDRLVVRTGLPLFGLTPPCMRIEKDPKFGESLYSIPTDQCFKMTKPQRWRGLWRNDFEGSQFCPAPAQQCGYVEINKRKQPLIWLEFSYSSPAQDKGPPGGLYAVDFIGRRTAFRGSYGHMGTSDHEIIVDRMISIKEVEPPPPQMTEKQTAAYLKSCEAAGQCILSDEAKALIRRQKQ